MTKETTILNLDKINFYDRAEIAELLIAWNENLLPEGFIPEGGKILERNGIILLVNSENQAIKMNGIDSEFWYTDPESGEEGFRNDLSPESLERLGLQ